MAEYLVQPSLDPATGSLSSMSGGRLQAGSEMLLFGT